MHVAEAVNGRYTPNAKPAQLMANNSSQKHPDTLQQGAFIIIPINFTSQHCCVDSARWTLLMPAQVPERELRLEEPRSLPSKRTGFPRSLVFIKVGYRRCRVSTEFNAVLLSWMVCVQLQLELCMNNC